MLTCRLSITIAALLVISMSNGCGISSRSQPTVPTGPSAIVPECQRELDERVEARRRFNLAVDRTMAIYDDGRFHAFREVATGSWKIALNQALDENPATGEGMVANLMSEHSPLTYRQCLQDYRTPVPLDLDTEDQLLIDRYNHIVTLCHALPSEYHPEPTMFGPTCGNQFTP